MGLNVAILPVVTKDLPISLRFAPYEFLSRCKFSTLLQLVNQWLNFTYSRFRAFRYGRKNTNFGDKIRTHDFRTSRCSDYLLDHSRDEGHTVSTCHDFLATTIRAPPAKDHTVLPSYPGSAESPDRASDFFILFFVSNTLDCRSTDCARYQLSHRKPPQSVVQQPGGRNIEKTCYGYCRVVNRKDLNKQSLIIGSSDVKC